MYTREYITCPFYYEFHLILAPLNFQVPLQSNEGTKGLGCTVNVPPVDKKLALKTMIWRKAQERYEKSTQKTNMFEENSDGDNSD